MLRRNFLLASTAASYLRILGANDKVNLGLIGAGGRGQGVMGTFQKTSQVQVTAICDVYATCQGRSKNRPLWRSKTRPVGRVLGFKNEGFAGTAGA